MTFCTCCILSDLRQNHLAPTPLQIWVYLNKPYDEIQQLSQDVQLAIDDLLEFSLLHPRLRVIHSHEEMRIEDTPGKLRQGSPALEVWILEPKADFAFELLPGKAGALVHPSSASPGTISADLARVLVEIYSQEQIVHASHVKTHGPNHQRAQNILRHQSPEAVASIDKQLSRAVKSSPSYHLTFSLVTASGAPSSWDIQSLLNSHIEPLRKALASVTEINIASQIQLYSSYSPSIQPFQVEGQDGSFLRQNDLTAFVNAAEWPLSPSIGAGPTLNFIIYVPALGQLPLVIEEGRGQSWLVPQWGGIHIVNPALVDHPVWGQVMPEHLSSDDLSPAFETFSSQLLSLMGVLPLEYNGKLLPLPMRLQAHARLAGLTLRMKAASSLGSLARLAQHLSSIPIPKHVAQLVENAMGNLTASAAAFGESRWDDAVHHASIAYQDSEKAFFDKSMVGQVYFPDEHKVAVYLPLLGPIGVPLVVALIRELKVFIAKIRTRKA